MKPLMPMMYAEINKLGEEQIIEIVNGVKKLADYVLLGNDEI